MRALRRWECGDAENPTTCPEDCGPSACPDGEIEGCGDGCVPADLLDNDACDEDLNCDTYDYIAYETVEVGRYHSCGLTLSGDIECWGNNVSGQLGPGYYAGSEIALGQNHTCAVNDKGVVECDGANVCQKISLMSSLSRSSSKCCTVG